MSDPETPRFVDGRARGEIEEVDGHPYLVRASGNAVMDSASQIESWSAGCGHLSAAYCIVRTDSRFVRSVLRI